jgi:hypothetical protein
MIQRLNEPLDTDLLAGSQRWELVTQPSQMYCSIPAGIGGMRQLFQAPPQLTWDGRSKLRTKCLFPTVQPSERYPKIVHRIGFGCMAELLPGTSSLVQQPYSHGTGRDYSRLLK